MPIPRGFVEVHPLEDAPFISPGLLKLGGIVKFKRSRETTASNETKDAQIVNGFISRTGSGQMVHEFITRGGKGLPFKLAGSPGLNARLCAIKPGWIIWIQSVSEWRWDIGAAYDLVKLRDLALRLNEVDDELDRAILEQAGAYRAGNYQVGLHDISEPARHVKGARAARRASDAERKSQLHACRQLVNGFLAMGMPRLLSDVRQAAESAGFPAEVFELAVTQTGAEVVKRGSRKSPPMLRLPSADEYPVRIVASGNDQVRSAIEGAALDDERLNRELEERERAAGTASLDAFMREDPPGESSEDPDAEAEEDAALDDFLRQLAAEMPRRRA